MLDITLDVKNTAMSKNKGNTFFMGPTFVKLKSFRKN